jgi:hypothetical protein
MRRLLDELAWLAVAALAGGAVWLALLIGQVLGDG